MKIAGPAEIITSIMLIALIAASSLAGFVTIEPINGRLGEIQPPVIFTQPSDIQVNTSIGPNGTSAETNVTIPPTYIIGLLSRAAVYWTNFSYDPIAAGDMKPLNTDNCTWYWDGTNQTLVGIDNGTSADYGGECILLVNRYIPPGRTIYVDLTFQWARIVAYILSSASYVRTTASTFSDIVFLNKTNINSTEDLYTTGNLINWTIFYISFINYGRILRSYSGAQIYHYNTSAGWSILASNTTVYYNVGEWYDLLGVRNNTSGWIAEYKNTTLVVNATNSTVNVNAIGLGMYVGVQSNQVQVEETVYYKELVITINRPPTYVNVTGLQPGWTVDIYNDTGSLVASATASGNSVSIDFSGIKMLYNGTIVVYDNAGNLVTESTFTWIVGGDVYYVAPAWLGSVYNILNFKNNDTKTTYNAYLYLLNATVSGGTINQLYIWLESGGVASYPINISNNTLVRRYTSIIPVYPLYPGQIYLYWNATLGTNFTANLLFIYFVNGTYVIYPINLIVRS